MGALASFFSYPNKILTDISPKIYPQLVRILLLLLCIAWKSYKLLTARYNYTSRMNTRSPKFRYRKKSRPDLGECRICISEFAEGDEVREVADCKHAFHRKCVEKWLTEYKPTCPLCRSSVVPPGAVAEYRKMQEELALLLTNALNGKGCSF